MAILVYVEHDNQELKSDSLKLINAACQIDNDVHALVAGSHCQSVAEQASNVVGVTKVLCADSAEYQHQLAENIADLVAELGKD
ncbi:MAG: electron transfer flavoprotein subunit alpha/FixB family protein, partial [Paraglaciecola sp.]|nr:electron transfer flavoprotein subunit alpha/FixB family protein [Paraglaciecola sp.]